MTSFHAVGKLKVANLLPGSLFYLIIVVSYFCLEMGFPLESVFIVTIVVSILVQMTESLLLKRLLTYSVRSYFKEVIWSCFLDMLISEIIPYLLTTILVSSLIR